MVLLSLSQHQHNFGMVTQHNQSHLLQLELGRYNFKKKLFAKVLKTFFLKPKVNLSHCSKKKW